MHYVSKPKIKDMQSTYLNIYDIKLSYLITANVIGIACSEGVGGGGAAIRIAGH